MNEYLGNLASFVLYAAYVGIGLSGVSTFYAETMKGNFWDDLTTSLLTSVILTVNYDLS